MIPPRVGTGAVWTRCGGASPYDLPERVALDALASLARRVGASAVLLAYTLNGSTLSSSVYLTIPDTQWMEGRLRCPAASHVQWIDPIVARVPHNS